MSDETNETGLEVRPQQSMELAPSASAAEKQFEIQSAIIISRRFPRNEDQAYAKLIRAAQRTSFAESASYSFKRGTTTVDGPSINLAREAARAWGNIRHGLEVVRDDEETRQIRGWAWDLETNVKVSAEDDFKKLKQKRVYDAMGNHTGTQWVPVDERDLRELTNRRGAILIRNCILQLIPCDFIDDTRDKCTETLQKKAVSDPEGEKKKVILAFSGINVTPEMLEAKLGHKLATCSPAEIAELRKIYKSIDDGNSSWAEFMSDVPVHPDQKQAKDAAKTSTTASASKGKQTQAPKSNQAAATTEQAENAVYSDTEPDPFATGELGLDK